MNKKVSIDFVWNTLGTTLNAFNSLFYLVIITRINGMKDAGIFTIGFAIACLLYMVGTYSGRVFQVTDNNDEHTDIDYFNMHIITILFLLQRWRKTEKGYGKMWNLTANLIFLTRPTV